jgi:hypothetical protein
MLARDVELDDSTYAAGRCPGRQRKPTMSDRVEKLRQKQAAAGQPAPAKKEKPLVQGSCGHLTKRGKPGEPCGACRNRAEVEAAVARRKERSRPSVPKFKRLDAKAGRLPDRARFELAYDSAQECWTGALEIAGFAPFTDASSGVFKLLTKLDQQYRKAAAKQVLHPCRNCRAPMKPEHSGLCDGCPCNSPLGTNDGIPCATCGQPRRNGECLCRREPTAGTLRRECSASVAAVGHPLAAAVTGLTKCATRGCDLSLNGTEVEAGHIQCEQCRNE